MRIDEIDLYGNILISGFTGSEGQILTYNTSGGFDWGTASGGSGGPTSSYFKTSGYNYVICETVNTGNPSTDALTNGTNLANAYDLAKTLDVGTKSATNRVVVLLMPGDYDITTFLLDTSFIDLVGFSTNPYDTILRSTAQYATLEYSLPVDSALKNLYLKPGTFLSVDNYEGAGDGSYLRWENLILSGNTFWDGTNYGFTNIYGEFKNIKVLDNCFSFVSSATIDGIFDNIEVGDNTYAFYSGSVSGTFSNISLNTPSACFNSNNGALSGYYENINISDGSSGAFQGYSINGTFKNIRIGGVGVSAFIANSYSDLSGTYENIQITDATNAFYSVETSIYGTYKNIEIGNLTNTSFSGTTVSGVFEDIKVGGNNSQYFFYGSLSGQFKNIEVGDVSDAAFSAIGSIDGNYENITIGNVTNNAFKSTDIISGSFKNIKIGDITNNNAFYADSASGQIVGTFDEIQIGNIASTTGYFFTANATMSGTFSNIEIGDASQWATGGISMFASISSGSIIGSYKNIKVGNTSVVFYPTGPYLNGTFENIEFGSTSYAFYANSGSILGTYSNIKSFSPQERFFYSVTDLIGTFENIEISNSIAILSFSADNSLSGIFKNIKFGDLSTTSDTFYSGVTDLTGTFENIEVGNGNSSFDIFVSDTGNISGTFSNIKIGDNFIQAFFTPGYISGSYKDITIGDLGSGRIFYGTEISVGTTIDNLYSNTRIHDGTILKGKLINSTIIDSVNSWQLSIDVSVSPMPIVENCKLITNGGGGYSIVPVNGGSVTNIQVLYTATNQGFDDALFDTLMSPNYNIVDASLS